jgi:hypothetical protein
MPALEGYSKLHIEITDDGTIEKWTGQLVSAQKQVRFLRQELSNTSYNEAQRQSIRLLLADAQIGLQATQTRSRELFGTLSLLPGPMGNLFGVVNMTLIAMRELSQLSFKDLQSQFQILKSLFTGESLSGGIPRTASNLANTGTNAVSNAASTGAGTAGGNVVGQTAEGAALGTVAGTAAVKATSDAIKEETKSVVDSNFIFNAATQTRRDFRNTNSLVINTIDELEKSNSNLSIGLEKGRLVMSQVPYATRELTLAEKELLTTNNAVVVSENGMIKALEEVTFWQKVQVTWWNLTGNALKAYDAVVLYTTGLLESLGLAFNVANIAAKGLVLTIGTLGIGAIVVGLGALAAALYELATGTAKADAEMKQLGVDVQENTEFLKDQLGINQRFQQENIARMKASNAAESDLRKQNLKDAKDNLNQINDAYDQAVRNRDAIERRVFEGKGGEKGGEIMKKANEEVLKLQTERNNQIAKINETGYNDQEIKLKLSIEKSLKNKEAAIQLEIDKENTKSDVLKKLQDQRDAIIDAQNAKKGVTLGPNEIAEREKKNADVRRNAVLDDAIRRAQDQIDIHQREKEAASKDSEEYFQSLKDIAQKEYEKQLLEAEKSEHDKANLILNAKSKLQKALDDITDKEDQAEITKQQLKLNGLLSATQEYYDQERALEMARYKKQQDDYEGNAEMLELLAKEHQQKMTAITVQELKDRASTEQEHAKYLEFLTEEYFAAKRTAAYSEYAAEKGDAEMGSQQQIKAQEKYSNNLVQIKVDEINRKHQIALTEVGWATDIGNILVSLSNTYAKGNKDIQHLALAVQSAAQIAKIIIDANAGIATATAVAAPLLVNPITAIPAAAQLATVTAMVKTSEYISIAGVLAATAAGFAQIDGASGGGGGGDTINRGKNYGSGGYISGPSHTAGGVPAMLEGGEAVMTRGAVTAFGPILSLMNVAAGGVPFTQGAVGQVKWDNPKSPGSPTEPQIIKTYVVQSELTSAQQRQARLKSLSTL